jgi:hypothetical protein
MKSARRASIYWSMSADIAVDAADPAEHVREPQSVTAGELPAECSAQSVVPQANY